MLISIILDTTGLKIDTIQFADLIHELVFGEPKMITLVVYKIIS
jgi:hypothetical protein